MIHACPNCRTKLSLDASYAGRNVACGSCQHVFTAPTLVPAVVELLRGIGKATLDHAAYALRENEPFDTHLFTISEQALATWKETIPSTEERTAALRWLASTQPNVDDVRGEAEKFANDMATPELRDRLIDYLERLPEVMRRALRIHFFPDSTRTSPPILSLDEPKDLLLLLPPRIPQFKPGDQPIRDQVILEELLGIGGFGEVWKALKMATSPARYVAVKFFHGTDAASLAGREADHRLAAPTYRRRSQATLCQRGAAPSRNW